MQFVTAHANKIVPIQILKTVGTDANIWARYAGTRTAVSHTAPSGNMPLVYMTQAKYSSLLNEVDSLRLAVEKLKQLVDPDPCEIVEMSNDDAKLAIAKYFKAHDGESIYPSDVAEALSLDYQQTKSVMNELLKEGAIARA